MTEGRRRVVPAPRPVGEKHGSPKTRLHRLQMVVDQYLSNGFNKRQALLTAGYAESTAANNPQFIFDDPWVVAEIARRMKVAADKAEVTVEWWLRRMKAIADAGETTNPHKVVQPNGAIRWDFTDATPETLSLITKIKNDYKVVGKGEDMEVREVFEVGFTEPIEALNAIGRHLGVFNDSVDVTHSLSVTDRLMRGRERIRQLNASEEKADEKENH